MPLSPAEREARERARAAFDRKIREILAAVDRLSDDAVARALRLLEEAQSRLLAELGRVPAESWRAQRLRALRRSVDELVGDLVRRYQAEFPGLLDQAHELGIDLAEEPLAAAGARLAPIVVGRDILEVIQAYSADLITNLGAEARRRINAVLSQAALGLLSPYEAMRAIAGELPGRATFSTLMARAEAIYRTEINRVLEVSNQARLGRMSERLPRMKKRWESVLDARVRRSHADTHGQVVRANAYYLVGGPGGLPALYPRDPSLPAKESVHCRCHSVPHVDDEVLDDLFAGSPIPA